MPTSDRSPRGRTKAARSRRSKFPPRHVIPGYLTSDRRAAYIPKDWNTTLLDARLIQGQLCCLQKFLFTTALLVNVRFDDIGYAYDRRYCYTHLIDAVGDLRRWDGEGDPPGPWIKEKVSERLGPGFPALVASPPDPPFPFKP